MQHVNYRKTVKKVREKSKNIHLSIQKFNQHFNNIYYIYFKTINCWLKLFKKNFYQHFFQNIFLNAFIYLNLFKLIFFFKLLQIIFPFSNILFYLS